MVGDDQRAGAGDRIAAARAQPASAPGGAPPRAPGDHAGLPDLAVVREQVFSVDLSAVRTVADLLELLGDLPSTPETLAAISTARAGDLTRLLPAGGGLGAHGHGSIELGASLLAAVAGLLDRLGQLPSTPPVVADDAHSWATQLWERLEETEPPAGHRHAG